MKCPKCSEKMSTRTGKFGDFFFCINSSSFDKHPTISAAIAKTLSDLDDGKDLTALKKKRAKLLAARVSVRKFNECNSKDYDLDHRINLTMASEFGYIMNSTDRFMNVDYGDDDYCVESQYW